MKILLVKPKWFVKGGIYRFLEGVKFTPLHLGILAALSEGHEVKAVDGDWDEIPYDEKFDLVGITVTTFTSQAAYRIADRFRKNGAKVVFGGVHPALMPEECLENADSIVIGEAEYVWPELLKDFQNNSLKKRYKANRPTDMNDVPFPRRDLLNEDSWFACIQATRGCPNKCRYCYLPSTPWSKFRKRDTDLVYEELASCPQKLIFFVDDNLFGDREYAAELIKKITPLKKVWAAQAPTVIAEDEELLKLMADSGCFNLQLGFQTVNSKSLKWAKIQNNIEKYEKIVKKLHEYNILVTGFFIFGFDFDDKDIFKRTLNIIKETGIDEAHLYILTPYPGTELYRQFQKEGRLIEKYEDRRNYGWANAVFKPKLMTADELEKGVQEAYLDLHRHFRKKLPGTIIRRLPWLIKQPTLLKFMIRGGLKGSNIFNRPS